MNASKMKIISISGVSGGGKTTIVEKLKRNIPKSKALYFDEFDFDGPSSIVKWVEEGSDYNLWNLQPMIDAIETIKRSNIGETEFLFLDFPFARKHTELSKYLDYTIFVDTPLDIALARRLLRDHSNSDVQVLMDDIGDYLSKGRIGYEEMLNTIKPNSDYVIDGKLSVDHIIGKIKEVIDAQETSADSENIS